MTALSLIFSAMLAWMPTIDGQRQELPYIEADLPYVLGISVAPPNSADITVIQDTILWQGISQGTFDICTITSYEPVLLYGDGLLQYTIVPEPTTLLLLITAIFLKTAIFLNRKTPICTKIRRQL